MLAHRGRYAQQVQRAGTAHAHQFGHEGFWLIDVFQHFHAHDFARATIGQRQRQTVADQTEIRFIRLRVHLPRQVTDLVVFTVGEDHRRALTHRKQGRDPFAAADIQQGVVGGNGKPFEQFAAVARKPAVMHCIVQAHVSWRHTGLLDR
ncbi:hypothetical protein D3C72_788100 [compost metagenome]